MVRSLPATEISTTLALGFTNPRFREDGIGCEKRSNVSGGKATVGGGGLCAE